MTPAERKEMLSAELDRARCDATDGAYEFIRLCEAHPRPPLDALEEAARVLYQHVGRVAGFAHMLREARS